MHRSISRTRLTAIIALIAVFASLLGAAPAGALVLPEPFTIDDASKVEGDLGTSVVRFKVRRANALERSEVTYETRDGTAQGGATAAGGADYQTTSGTLVFEPTETEHFIEVTIFGDLVGEAGETFFVDIEPVDGEDTCTNSDCTATGTILNDDDPSIAIDDVSSNEGDAGSTTFTFTVTREGTDPDGSVTYTTRNGTAVGDTTAEPGVDYQTTSGTVTFTGTESSKTIEVTVFGDTAAEPDETFFVDLTASDDDVCTNCTATGTIQNDDGLPPSIVIGNEVVTEGDDGPTTATFDVDLTESTTETVTVHYATNDGTATVADSDYAAASGTLTFGPGTTRQTISVAVNGDTKDETNESFSIILADARNATIQDAQGDGRIDNDDASPTVSVKDGTVAETAGNGEVTIELSAPSGKQVTVAYSTADGTAQTGTDYTAVEEGIVTFAPGETSATASVAITDDTADESDETLTVVLSNPVNATIEDGTATVTITDDDGEPSIAISDVTVDEGDAGTADATFTVTLSTASGLPVTLDYTTADATATTPDGDYVAKSGTLTFAPGETSTTIVVAVNGDTRDELEETFLVDLADPSGATIADPQGEGTITDDDATPTLTIDDVTADEGDAGQTEFTFTVTLSTASGQEVTVDYATVDGTATSAGDYDANSGTLTFEPGEVTKEVTVLVDGDTTSEADENFSVELTSPSNATLSDGEGLATISNDDPGPEITITDVTIDPEGDTGTVTALFTVQLSEASAQTITVDYGTENGSATAPEDYSTTTGTLRFTPGQTSKTVNVVVNGDTLPEDDETFVLRLSDVTGGATFGDAEGIGTIPNDDGAPPSLGVDDVTAAEGDGGSTTFTFTVTRSGSSTATVTVDYAVNPATATSPDDFTATSGTLTFAPGVMTQEVTVDVVADDTHEPTESFTVDLSNPTNATVGDSQGVGTITNDDPVPAITVDDVTASEGDAGPKAFTFNITLSNPSSETVTVDVATALGTAQSNDITAVPITTITFKPGETSKTVTVNVVGDATHEHDETFFLDLTNATGGSLDDERGTGTITNDDTAPTVAINSISVSEGDDQTTSAVFTVTLSAASGKTVTVKVDTANGSAVAPGDYTAKSEVVTFTAGETSKTFTVSVNGDTTTEADETFTATLSEATNVSSTGDAGTATITNDDAVPTISVNDASVVEGDTGTTTLTLTLTLSNPSDTAVTVEVSTSEGTAGASEFTAVPTTVVTFEPGSTTKTVTVDVTGDTLPEADETFFLDLANASGATIVDNQGEGTITDDDDDPSISIDDATVVEGDADTKSATFTVTLSGVSGQTVTVQATTEDGTATAGSDYAAKTQTLEFAPGETTKLFTVTVTGDTIDEDDETYSVVLSGVTNATIADGTGTGTITDDDDASVTLAIDDVTVDEGDAGSTDATFTITKTGTTERTVTVVVNTADGTATAPADYTALVGELVTFAPEDDTKTVTVKVKGDTIDEAHETFMVVLSDATNSAIAEDEGTATGTITDNDATPTLSVADVTVTEGDAGTTPASFVVTLSAASGRTVTVDFAAAHGTATAADYTAVAGVLTFAAGQTTKTVVIAVKGDTVDEADETFTLVLSNPANATLADGTATGTITDDDEPAPAPAPGDPAAGQGYSLVGEDGSLYAFGTAKNVGDMKGTKLNAPVIGVAYTPGGNGYWLVAKDGGIFTFGDAAFFGSMGAKPLNSPVIGMAATPTGRGYWLFAGDGGIFTFGDAEFFGSMGDKKLNAPVINMEPLESGNGYWLVAADGGIFTFGQAEFFGSMGDTKLNQPVFDMTSTDTDEGYWLVARDGGVFSFGDAEAKFFGNPVNDTNPRPTRIIGMDSTPGSLGYWIADANGKVWNYGNAQALGDRYLAANPAPMIGFASVPGAKP